MHKFNVTRRVTCITVTSRGLGSQCADALAAAGAAVVGVARREHIAGGIGGIRCRGAGISGYSRGACAAKINLATC
ncbi:MAG: hypothetical protein CMM73_02975 [Rhodospirillaceae bacterium]|nr:hypothetical protein [Rhodospirillaceae bacterium]